MSEVPGARTHAAPIEVPDDLPEDVAAALRAVLPVVTAAADRERFDPEVPAAFVRAGLHRMPLGPADGGHGPSLDLACRVLAAIGAVDGSAALGFAMHLHVVGSALSGGGWAPPALRRLVDLVRDHGALVNSAATEEGGGSPARGALPATVATPIGTGWVIDGQKAWTTWLPGLRLAVVSAGVQADDSDGPGELVNLLVDLESPGVERLPGDEPLGMRASASGRLRLAGVAVDGDALVTRRRADAPDPRGPEPAGWFGLCIAAAYLGVGEGARRVVARWALARRPGDGSRPVADVPTVRVRLGRVDARLRTARIVLLEVARRWDAAEPSNRAAILPDVQLAKLVATEAAVEATDEALRIAGGPGLLSGPLERAFRDVRAGLVNPPIEDVALAGFASAVLAREQAAG